MASLAAPCASSAASDISKHLLQDSRTRDIAVQRDVVTKAARPQRSFRLSPRARTAAADKPNNAQQDRGRPVNVLPDQDWLAFVQRTTACDDDDWRAGALYAGHLRPRLLSSRSRSRETSARSDDDGMHANARTNGRAQRRRGRRAPRSQVEAWPPHLSQQEAFSRIWASCQHGSGASELPALCDNGEGDESEDEELGSPRYSPEVQTAQAVSSGYVASLQHSLEARLVPNAAGLGERMGQLSTATDGHKLEQRSRSAQSALSDLAERITQSTPERCAMPKSDSAAADGKDDEEAHAAHPLVCEPAAHSAWDHDVLFGPRRRWYGTKLRVPGEERAFESAGDESVCGSSRGDVDVGTPTGTLAVTEVAQRQQEVFSVLQERASRRLALLGRHIVATGSSTAT